MPHEVTMPQLGMAQDAGKIVSWLKAPGDRIARGDALFEVETDKAVMEVESPADGYLTGVTFAAGDDVPVGRVIAMISDTADDDAAAPAAATAPGDADAVPEGQPVTMPQLGMAQDTGLLVAWHKAPGDAVEADDILFEVETDKSTMEVAAGHKGWLAATLAHPGEDVPVGDPVAIIADAPPAAPVARPARDAGAALPAPEPEAKPAAAPKATQPADTRTDPGHSARRPPAAPRGRILASPKARRLALQQGLDLGRLVSAGHPQPFHARDLDVLRALPVDAPATAAEAPRRLTARCAGDGFADLARWAGETYCLAEAAILAGLAGASLGTDGPVTVAVERLGAPRTFAVPPGRALAAVDEAEAEDTPALIVRDLRGTRVSGVAMGAEATPVLTVARRGKGLEITLECAPGAVDAGAAIRLLDDFAGRMEQPLRHLL